ncbi:MAG: Fur family transcriptional regulator [Anaerolineae bacterium]|jgi:Fe2+ or Zn2+ uptake regulation protein|nr:Fur family transcriptional regulator [Anaerolineae bacterium]
MMEEILTQLRENGCRITPQRREILNILFSSKQHPKAEDIYAILQKRMPETSLATVYNTLNRLKELGLVDVIGTAGEESVRYDPVTDAHDHLYCLSCGRIFDVEHHQHEPLAQSQPDGFKIIREQTTYYGVCSDCQGNAGTE